jgi:hypothetical protein
LDHARAIYADLAEFGVPLKGIRPEDFTDRNSIPGVDFDLAWERRV